MPDHLGEPPTNTSAKLQLVLGAVTAAEKKLSGNVTFNSVDRYAQQAVELSKLPTPAARAKYVKRFYSHGPVDLHTGVVGDHDSAAKAWAMGSDGLGFWFTTRYDGAFRSVQDLRKAALADPTRRYFWAVIAVASDVVQDIRALHPLARLAFNDGGGHPVAIDDQLSDIASQCLAVADLRVEIAEEPSTDTPEGAQAGEVWRRQVRDLDGFIINPILQRVAALFEYRDRLRAVQVQTQLIYRLSGATGIDAKLEDLVRRSGSNDIGSARLNAARSELQEAERVRSVALAAVRGDYLNALTP
ncbi:hypothetical protein [Gordonia rubripertincta]|uniref:Uncharacterized protein n=1 Tax=Gordonia rubripertincta TaxID=36822 RepID=A0ABT4N332_GORRU|nr:hypothetical protein [Gordonia rubripertincta]MCZ4553685.1 hypothetical protein [Gordonia rubripertincta]